MYTWLPLNSIDDLSKLSDHISSEFAPELVARSLRAVLSSAVKSVLIETDYIDKDYRSTYYNFYSKKGLRYQLDCVRLHFFDGAVQFVPDTLTLACPDGKLTHHFFGYMVLRPTGIATIGRTVLSPDIRRGASRLIITADHKVHVLGYKLSVHGFPSMNQHVDISVCAHAACWSILRHYSERYTIHPERLIHDITVMAHEFNPGGLVPSRGLQMGHAERVFQEAGTFPVHVARDGAGDESFYRQLHAYVESGFPLFAALHDIGHAIAVVGYEWRTPKKSVPGTPVRYAWDEVQALAVVDDNHLPYLTVPLTKGADLDYSVQSIDSFIVALPEKIFYPADAVHNLAPTLFALGGAINLPSSDNMILRYFITTASAFRSFVRERSSEFDPALLTTIMKLPFAQFLWIVELATEDQWAVGQIEARAVLDATASLREFLPFWLVHSRTDALVFTRQKVGPDPSGMGAMQLSPMGHAGFSRMERNLRPTQAK